MIRVVDFFGETKLDLPGGKTSVEGSLFFNNSITNALEGENDPQALFHQLGIRLGFLF